MFFSWSVGISYPFFSLRLCRVVLFMWKQMFFGAIIFQYALAAFIFISAINNWVIYTGVL